MARSKKVRRNIKGVEFNPRVAAFGLQTVNKYIGNFFYTPKKSATVLMANLTKDSSSYENMTDKQYVRKSVTESDPVTYSTGYSSVLPPPNKSALLADYFIGEKQTKKMSSQKSPKNAIESAKVDVPSEPKNVVANIDQHGYGLEKISPFYK
jgi:hypothetical protein